MANTDDDLLNIDEPIDRLDELVSLLLDESLADHEFAELEETLMASGEARRKYVGMMQLHVDLLDHYRPEESPTTPKSPVLGFLADSQAPFTNLPRDAKN